MESPNLVGYQAVGEWRERKFKSSVVSLTVSAGTATLDSHDTVTPSITSHTVWRYKDLFAQCNHRTMKHTFAVFSKIIPGTGNSLNYLCLCKMLAEYMA